MKYDIHKVDNGVRVTGYQDGSDWVILPERSPDHVGVAGLEYAWCCDRLGTLQLLHAPSRRLIATIALGELSGAKRPITVSRDGARLYALVRHNGAASALTVVDIATGHVAAGHQGFPTTVLTAPVERDDGRLLLNSYGHRLLLLDPVGGQREESSIPGEAAAQGAFASGSPDGRWWLRFDRAVLPVHDSVQGLVDRLFGRKQPERRYGLTFQLWEAFPLRFVRRVVVAWLAANEMPGVGSMRGRRVRLWNAVSDARRLATDDPLAPEPPRSAYPAELVANDQQWDAVQRSLNDLASVWVLVEGWAPDGAAFWARTNGFLSCVGVDGTTSPRLYTERLGLQEGTWLPCAASYEQVVPLESRRASVVYRQGTALFDGTPSASPYSPLAIATRSDGWVPRNLEDATARDLAAVRKQLAVLKEQRRQIRVPLREWTEEACVTAIDALTAQVTADLYGRAVEGELRVVFELGGESIDEERFFTDVRTRFPSAAPALRRLVERYCAVARPLSALYSDGKQGHEFLTHAAQALGLLDAAALPILRRYGATVDVEHQYRFAREIVPAVIAAHGWTDAMVDFAFWVLAWDFYNALPDYATIWNGWGLRDAVMQREPRALARHTAADLAETIAVKNDPGYYGTGGFDRLAREIPQPHEPGLWRSWTSCTR